MVSTKVEHIHNLCPNNFTSGFIPNIRHVHIHYTHYTDQDTKLVVNFSCTWGIWLHILMMSQNVLIKLHILLICCDIFLPTVLPAQGSG